MKVLHISHMVEKDGSSISLLDIIDAEQRRGDSQLVTVRRSVGFIVEELQKRGIPYHVVPFRFNCYPQLKGLLDCLLFPLRFVRDRVVNRIAQSRLESICKSFGPDVIHTNNGITDLGYRVSKKYHIKHLWHIRECQGTGYGCVPFPCMHSLVGKLRDPVSTVVCVSEFVKETFDLSNNAKVIYDGVRHRSDASFPDVRKDDYFLFIGQMTPAKGLDDIISAMIAFYQQGGKGRLLIVGETPKQFEGFARVQRNRLLVMEDEKKVEFLGLRNDVDELMRHAKAVIVASRQEGFGRVAPEALINKCFVIGRNSTGTAEVLRKTKSGIMFQNVEQLVSAMKRIEAMTDDEMHENCRVAQSMAVKMFSTEGSVGAFLDLCRA